LEQDLTSEELEALYPLIRERDLLIEETEIYENQHGEEEEEEEGKPEEQEEGIIEQYRLIKDLPNYSISNLGQVRNNKTGRILRQSLDTNGYMLIRFSIDGKKINKWIHKLVAEAFLVNPDNLPQIDHINRNRTDNNLTNLRWVSGSCNCKNKKSMKGVVYEFMDELPADAVVVENYNGYDFIDLYYSHLLRKFLYNNGVKYRLLHNHLRPNQQLYFACATDTEGHIRKIALNKYQRLCGFV
jgi:hypothetical protein